MESILNKKISELTKNSLTATEFLARFPGSESTDLYTFKELAVLNEINPSFLAELLHCYDDSIPLSYIEIERFKSYSLDDILSYLEKTHLFYYEVRFKKIERIILNCIKVSCQKPSIIQKIENAYVDWKKDLTRHMEREEEVLFPHAKHLYLVAKKQAKATVCTTNAIEKCFSDTHQDETDHSLFGLVYYGLPNHYTIDTTKNYMELARELKIFQQDLTLHAWVEEELLIPQVATLRRYIMQKLETKN